MSAPSQPFQLTRCAVVPDDGCDAETTQAIQRGKVLGRAKFGEPPGWGSLGVEGRVFHELPRIYQDRRSSCNFHRVFRAAVPSNQPCVARNLPLASLRSISATAMSDRRMPKEIELSLGLDEPEEAHIIKSRVARMLGCSIDNVPTPVVVRRAIDARRGKVQFRIRVELGVATGARLAKDPQVPREGKGQRCVIIVGDGPAGLFCAYELACHAIPSIVVERGKTVQPRRHDLKQVLRHGAIERDSNYCFGEGGAGTFSDGKLYTRATKRGEVRRVLELLVEHGAPSDILIDARPHIGSNNLPKVVVALREHLSQIGVDFQIPNPGYWA